MTPATDTSQSVEYYDNLCAIEEVAGGRFDERSTRIFEHLFDSQAFHQMRARTPVTPHTLNTNTRRSRLIRIVKRLRMFRWKRACKRMFFPDFLKIFID
jgi:hypothetical protein